METPVAEILKGYPHIFPPFPHDAINRGQDNLAIVAGNNILLEKIDANAQGYEGWLRRIALVCSDFTKAFFIFKSRNAFVEREYTHIAHQMGAIATPVEVFIPLKQGKNICLYITVTAPVTVSYALYGYQYPTGGEVR
jgi:hypothetical protein